jgi:beta-glucosidase
MVLLKNDGALPLSASAKKILVAGPLAESVRVLHGNYAGTASHATTALDGIRKQFSGAEVSFVPGMNFLRSEAVVPSSVLRTADNQPGLKAEYFSGDLTATPQTTRVDQTVNLQLFHPGPDSVAPPDGMKDFSARWTGFVVPTESGSYRVGLAGSMHRLWFDNKLVVDDVMLHDPTPKTVTVQLQKGHRYPVKVEYSRGGFGTRLVWLDVIADPVGKAVAAAKQADVVVAVVGITSQLEGEEMKVDRPASRAATAPASIYPRKKKTCWKRFRPPASR